MTVIYVVVTAQESHTNKSRFETILNVHVNDVNNYKLEVK